jgi:transposase-like protein
MRRDGSVRAHGLQESRHILYTLRMPWMRTTPERQRRAFYRDHESGQWSMTELCQRFQISRPTGYKWIERIREEGLAAVELCGVLFLEP